LIPLARVGALALTALTLGLTGELAKEIERAAKFMKDFETVKNPHDASADQFDLSEANDTQHVIWINGTDLENLQHLLKEIGLAPHYGGMKLVKIRHKGFLWAREDEAKAFGEVIPHLAYMPDINST
jgi:hypothetical protein